MADVKKSLPEVGARIETPRFLTVFIDEVFDRYEDMVMAGYTEPTHYRGDFKVNGKSTGEYSMKFACSPNPDGYRRSTKKSASFNDMVQKQRNKSLVKMDESSLITFFEGIYSEIGDIADRIKEVNNSNSNDSGIYYNIENIRTTLTHSVQAQIEDLMRRL